MMAKPQETRQSRQVSSKFNNQQRRAETVLKENQIRKNDVDNEIIKSSVEFDPHNYFNMSKGEAKPKEGWKVEYYEDGKTIKKIYKEESYTYFSQNPKKGGNIYKKGTFVPEEITLSKDGKIQRYVKREIFKSEEETGRNNYTKYEPYIKEEKNYLGGEIINKTINNAKVTYTSRGSKDRERSEVYTDSFYDYVKGEKTNYPSPEEKFKDKRVEKIEKETPKKEVYSIKVDDRTYQSGNKEWIDKKMKENAKKLLAAEIIRKQEFYKNNPQMNYTPNLNYSGGGYESEPMQMSIGGGYGYVNNRDNRENSINSVYNWDNIQDNKKETRGEIIQRKEESRYNELINKWENAIEQYKNRSDRTGIRNKYQEAYLATGYLGAKMGKGGADIFLHPWETTKGFVTSTIHPVKTFKELKTQFKNDPYGTGAYMAGQRAMLGVTGRTIARVPMVKEKITPNLQKMKEKFPITYSIIG
jgi:hypothetical protein